MSTLTLRDHDIPGAGHAIRLHGNARADAVAHTRLRVGEHALAWLLASSDLFVCPSRGEAQPEAVLQAKGCGIPVLAAAGGAARCIEPGTDGLLVDCDTAEGWAHTIAALLDQAPLRLAMGRAARATVEHDTPRWRDVLEQDVLPAWRNAAARRPSSAVAM